MPDYASIDRSQLAPIYRNVRKAYDPTTGQQVTEAGQGSVFQTAQEQVDPYTMSEQQIQDWISGQTPEPQWDEFTDIDAVPELQYNMGKMTIKRQYSDDVRIADMYPPGSPQYITLHQEASATMLARMAELNAQRDKIKNGMQQLNRNYNLTRDQRREGKMQYLEANPVYEPPKVQDPYQAMMEQVRYQKATTPKPAFTQGQVQRTLGDLATSTDIIDKDTAISYAASKLGPNFAQEFPEALDIIEARSQSETFDPLALPGTTEQEGATVWDKIYNKQYGQPEQQEPTRRPAQQQRTRIEIPDITVEPLTTEVFELNVARLKSLYPNEPEKALEYYNKWAGKF